MTAGETPEAPSSAVRRRLLQRTAKLGALALLPGCTGFTPPGASVAAPKMPLASHPEALPVPALPAGGTVAVIAPASPASIPIDQVAAWLTARGFVPRIFPGASTGRTDYLAAADNVRLQDLHAAFADPAIDAIFCLRGGYGSARLLDRIDFGLLERNPKPFVGYSDITALLLAITRRSGFITFHGPMLSTDLIPAKQAPTESALFDLLQGRQQPGSELPRPAEFPLETISAGVAQGRLIGGNLAIIGSTLGTPYQIELDGTILFIEDVGETPQKIDRLLTQLRLSGQLEKIRGVLIGDFSEIDDPHASVDHSSANHARLRQVWRELLQPLAVPVLAGWRSGHCDPNLTLPIGATVRLDAGRQRLWLEQEAVHFCRGTCDPDVQRHI